MVEIIVSSCSGTTGSAVPARSSSRLGAQFGGTTTGEQLLFAVRVVILVVDRFWELFFGGITGGIVRDGGGLFLCCSGGSCCVWLSAN